MRQFQIDRGDNRLYPMGVTVLDHGIHVSTAIAGDVLNLVLYEPDAEEPAFKIRFPEEDRKGDVWEMTLMGDGLDLMEYSFEADGIQTWDPYGRRMIGREIWGDPLQTQKVLRSPVSQTYFDWEGDKPLQKPYDESIVYRIHIREFTMHRSSKVTDKGTFQAVIEKIPYLQELGITTLELMPVNDFQELFCPVQKAGSPYGEEHRESKLICWGYTESCYFAPKASYSQGKKKDPVNEFKSLVKALHQAGIEIVTELYFTGKENPLLVLDAVRFWVREYHLDGIHLVGNLPHQLLAADPYLADTKLWAANWDGADRGRKKHLGEYNDGFLNDMRRFLKGGEAMLNAVIYHTRRNPTHCCILNYIANTNGFTMMDMVSYDIKHNEANGENNKDGTDLNYSWNCGMEGPTRGKKITALRKKQIRNALLLVFLSQGTPLLMSGDEWGNSKSGNNNSYCQDNEISWLNWNQLTTNSDIFEFTKHVIDFRKNHPVFSGTEEPRVMDYLSCGYPDVSYHGEKTWCPEFENFRRQLGILYCGEYAKKKNGNADDYFYIVYNMHWEPHEFALPHLPRGKQWHLSMNTDDDRVNGFYKVGEEPVLINQKWFPAPPRTILVFIGYQVGEQLVKIRGKSRKTLTNGQ